MPAAYPQHILPKLHPVYGCCSDDRRNTQSIPPENSPDKQYFEQYSILTSSRFPPQENLPFFPGLLTHDKSMGFSKTALIPAKKIPSHIKQEGICAIPMENITDCHQSLHGTSQPVSAANRKLVPDGRQRNAGRGVLRQT